MDDGPNGDSNNVVTVDAADIIRLILGYLTSQGLHESARVLRTESGIGFPSHVSLVGGGGGSVPTTSLLSSHIQRGEWGSVLSALQLYQHSLPPLILEQVILESAETNGTVGLAVAQQLLSVARHELDSVPHCEEKDDTDMTAIDKNNTISKARSLEQRLAALAANPRKYDTLASKQQLLFGRLPSPNQRKSSNSFNSYEDYKQSRRDQLATEFQAQMTHTVPLNRLSTLIHQAIKWQAWTGQFPMMKSDKNGTDDDNDINKDDDGSQRKKKPTKKKKRKHFDLVVGMAAADCGAIVGDDDYDDGASHIESIPSQKIATIKFGKSTVCEVVTTLRNGLVTASSDGFVEIWELGGSYSLNTTDYAYQAQDQVMGHEDVAVLALSVSRDQTMLASGDSSGIVKIWKLENGACLRHYQAFPSGTSITALDWSPDGSKLLVASSEGLCREFGIVSQHVLQEYMGHSSMINSCMYYQEVDEGLVKIMTSSADGTVRVWETHGHCQAVWQPPLLVNSRTSNKNKINLIGTSIVVDTTSILTESPSIVAVCPVPSSPSRVVVVPRASTAFLVDGRNGTILQQYSIPSASRISTASATDQTKNNKNEEDGVVFCAATVTADWVYLCTTDNECLVFAINDGGSGSGSSSSTRAAPLVHVIQNFGIDSTTPTFSSNTVAEISQLIPHPHKPILVAFSNDKAQKKGIVAVWK